MLEICTANWWGWLLALLVGVVLVRLNQHSFEQFLGAVLGVKDTPGVVVGR